MRKTYAPSGIIIGLLVGLLAMAKFGIVIGIIAFIGVSIVAWVAIRMLENALSSAIDAGADAIKKKWDETKKK